MCNPHFWCLSVFYYLFGPQDKSIKRKVGVEPFSQKKKSSDILWYAVCFDTSSVDNANEQTTLQSSQPDRNHVHLHRNE